MQKQIALRWGERRITLTLERKPEYVQLQAEMDGESLGAVSAQVTADGPWIVVRSDGAVERCAVVRDQNGIWVGTAGRSYYLETARRKSGPAAGGDQGGDEVRAPMTGTILAVHVESGQTVAKGDLLVVMEAMKMEYRLESEVDGKVARVECGAGDMLDVGTLLIKLEPASGA